MDQVLLMDPGETVDPENPLKSAQLSVGFHQIVIELLSKPGDVYFDWTSGDGGSFVGGDFCGRHVVGFEARDRCFSRVEARLADVLKRNEVPVEIPRRCQTQHLLLTRPSTWMEKS